MDRGYRRSAPLQRDVRQNHDARLGHLAHRPLQALATEPGLLRTAVWHLVGPERAHVVDDHAPDLKRPMRLERAVVLVREYARLQTVLRVVPLGQRFVERLVRRDRRARSEDLLA